MATVDLTAESFEPVYATASARHEGIVFGKVDTDAQRELTVDLGISSIPTLMAFRDGVLVRQVSDALPPRALEKFIDDVRSMDMATFGRDPLDDIPELDM
ncbi:MAG TPA: thioredoxin family protein [Actinotalea sp.]|nr:thioredoxin family protein [Actinotalea sp.]